jgi:CheY-like chemotaxis protein
MAVDGRAWAKSATRRAFLTEPFGLRVVRDLQSDHAGRGEAGKMLSNGKNGNTSTGTDFRPQEPNHKRLNGWHLLVVDDDDDVRELLVTLICEHGAIVTAAGSMLQAMRAFEGGSYDVVLSDLAMPGRDGYDLIEAIRRDDRGDVRDVRAIAVTAFGDDAHRRRAVAAGFDAYLTKPVDPGRLLATIITVAHGRPVRRHAPAGEDEH